MPVLSLSPPSGAANLLNVAGVPIAGRETGLSNLWSPTENPCWLQWKQAMDFTEEECCRLSAHHSSFQCCYVCFILGGRVNDPSNKYLQLPFFQLNWEKKKKKFQKVECPCLVKQQPGNNLAFSPCPSRLHPPGSTFVFHPWDSFAEYVKHPEERTLTQCPCCLA